MCGIVGILGHDDVADRLLDGLKRLEYRGYDSAGIATVVDGVITRRRASGKLINLQRALAADPLPGHSGIAHTRWATHGPPSTQNCHPMRSDPTAEFTVVHNGIITNSVALRQVLAKRGYTFESETDTETAAILAKYIWDGQKGKRLSFTELIKTVLKELEGSFAFVFKSSHYPNEVVAARRGSPLLIGVKSDKKLKVDFVDVEVAGPEAEAHVVDTRTSTSTAISLCLSDITLQSPLFLPLMALVASSPPRPPPRSLATSRVPSCLRMAFPSPSSFSLRPTRPPSSSTPSVYCISRMTTSRTSPRASCTSTASAAALTGP